MKVGTTFKKMALVSWPPPSHLTQPAAVAGSAADGIVVTDPEAGKLLAENLEAFRVQEQTVMRERSPSTSDGGPSDVESEMDEREEEEPAAQGYDSDSGQEHPSHPDNDDDVGIEGGEDEIMSVSSGLSDDDGRPGENVFDDDDKEVMDNMAAIEASDDEPLSLADLAVNTPLPPETPTPPSSPTGDMEGGSGASRFQQRSMSDCINDCKKKNWGGETKIKDRRRPRPRFTPYQQNPRSSASLPPQPAASVPSLREMQELRSQLGPRAASTSLVSSTAAPSPQNRAVSALGSEPRQAPAPAVSLTREDTERAPAPPADSNLSREPAAKSEELRRAPGSSTHSSTDSATDSSTRNNSEQPPPPLTPSGRGRKRARDEEAVVPAVVREAKRTKQGEEGDGGDAAVVAQEYGRGHRRRVATQFYAPKVCERCGESISFGPEAYNHECRRVQNKKKLPPGQELRCPDCGSTFTSEKRYENHLQKPEACRNNAQRNKNKLLKNSVK